MSTHSTGFLFQFNGNPDQAPIESWHRTLRGALRAKARAGGIGFIYRLTGDDSSEKVA